MGEEQGQDHVEQTLCLNCDRFSGCKHLRKKKIGFLPERVITEGSDVVCPDFVPAGETELKVRREIMGFAQGLVSLRALYYRSEPSIEDPEEAEEEDEEMYEDVPDFQGMLYGDDGNLRGLTAAEREDQLRYLTDEEGNLELDDEGNKIPRGSFPVRKYAEDLDGPVAPKIAELLGIQLESVPNVVRFWKTNELVPAVIRAEYDSGLIIAKSGKKTAPSKAKAAQSTKKDKDSEMAPRKPISVKKTKSTSGPAKKGPAKTSGPAKKGPVSAKKKKKTTSKKAPSKAKEETAEEEEAEASAPAEVDLSGVESAIATLDKRVAGVETLLEEVRDHLDSQVQTCVTLAHDAFMQKLNELGAAIGSGLNEVSDEAGASFWEAGAVPLDEAGENVQPDAQNLMSGPDGEQHSILLYLEQAEEEGEEGEEAGDEE